MMRKFWRVAAGEHVVVPILLRIMHKIEVLAHRRAHGGFAPIWI